MWVRTGTAARVYGVSRETIRRWANTGRIRVRHDMPLGHRRVWCPEAAPGRDWGPAVIPKPRGAPVPRLQQLARMEADGTLAGHCRRLLLDDDGLATPALIDLIADWLPEHNRRARSRHLRAS